MLQAQHIIHITNFLSQISQHVCLNLLRHTPVLLAATSQQAVSWLRHSVTGHSLHKLGYDPRLVHVGFVMEKVEVGQGFLE